MKKRLLLVGLVVFLGMAGVLCFWPQPRKAFAYPELELEPNRLPPDQNGFFSLEKAAAMLNMSDDDYTHITKFLNVLWENEPATIILKENAEALDSWDQKRIRQIEIRTVESYDQLVPYLKNWKRLAALQTLHARWLFENGSEAESFEQLLLTMDLGHRFQDSKGGIIHYGVGLSAKRMAVEQFSLLIGRTSLPDHKLIDIQNRLDGFRANSETLSNVIKVEFMMQCELIEGLAAGKYKFPGTAKSDKFFMKSRPVFDPNRTAEAFAEFARVSLQSLELPYAEMPILHLVNSINQTPTSIPRLLISGNASGIILYRSVLPAQKSLFAWKAEENSSISGLQTLFALRLYHDQNHLLPDTLNALIPEFMSSLPMDDCDGKPLRYFPEKKLLYSIGRDLEDAGGVKVSPSGEKLDLVFPISF